MQSILAFVTTYHYYASGSLSGPKAALLLSLCCGFLLFFVAIRVFVLALLYRFLTAIPAQYRDQSPGFVWLLLIPIANIVIAFFVYPKISSSFRNFFRAYNITSEGSCQEGPAIAICALGCMCWIPYVTLFCIPAMIVLLIILLVKFHHYKKQVLSLTSEGFPVITATRVQSENEMFP